MSLTRKLSSGSQSSQDQSTNEPKYTLHHGLIGNSRPAQQPPLTNGSAGASDSGSTTPQSSRWKYRKVTAPAAVPPGTSPTSQRIVHVVETHPTPDLLVNHVGGLSEQQAAREKHLQQAYDYSTQDMGTVENIGRPSALKSANTSGTAKSGRNVVIATPSIMEQMAAKTSAMNISGDELQETVINGGGSGSHHDANLLLDANQQRDSGLLMRTNSTGATAARGQQKNVIELSSAMVSRIGSLLLCDGSSLFVLGLI